MRRFETLRRARFQIGILIWMGFFLSLGSTAFAQDKPTKLSGAGMFKDYCAVCHGRDAKGHGPAASALKQAPPDLTKLAQRHDDKFPDAYVENVLRNGVKAPAHGDAEMPVWGPLFESMDLDPFISRVRINSLVSYLKSIQIK